MSGKNKSLAITTVFTGLILGTGLASGPAWGQAPGARPTAPGSSDAPAGDTTTGGTPESQVPPVAASSRELGIQTGLAAGGGVTPGGLRLGGTFLYQLSAVDWFEGAADFTIGGTGAGCAVEQGDDVLVCDHGPLRGRAGELSVGIRRFLIAQQQFTPYVQGRLGVRVLSFSGDEVVGVALLAIVGAGVRAQVHERVSIAGGARFDVGAGLFGKDLGGEPQFGLTVHTGVEFLLD